MANLENREIEVRFLEIDKKRLIARLQQLGAQDAGELLLEESIFYDAAGTWKNQKKHARIRNTGKEVFLTYKHNQSATAQGTQEIEIAISDAKKARDLLETLGLVLSRQQQKRRHSFRLNNVIIDIDTWPKVPTYVELEGSSEDAIKQAAASLNLDWAKVELRYPPQVLREVYGIDVTKLKSFTFDRIE